MTEIIASYLKEEFDQAFSILHENLTHNQKPQQNPMAYLLGGQSGAGKSILSNLFAQNHSQEGIITINGDEYRSFHPRFRQLQKVYGKDAVLYTQAFSGQMTEALINYLSDERYHLIIEGTLRTTEVPMKTCHILKEKGYTVNLAVMAVKPQLSYLSTILRYETKLAVDGAPRATPKEHHDRIVAALPENVSLLYRKGIFDNIRLFARSGKVVYDYQATPEVDAGEILKAFHGEWQAEEFVELLRIVHEILDYLRARNAPELAVYEQKFQLLTEECARKIQ